MLVCGHTVPASNVDLVMLGDKLGAQVWCDRCGDFFHIKRVRKRRVPVPQGTPLPDIPPF